MNGGHYEKSTGYYTSGSSPYHSAAAPSYTVEAFGGSSILGSIFKKSHQPFQEKQLRQFRRKANDHFRQQKAEI